MGVAADPPAKPARLLPRTKRVLFLPLLMNAVNVAVLLAVAGDPTWPYAWALGLNTIFWQYVAMAVLYRVNPELLNERAKGVKKDTKGFDRIFFKSYFPSVYLLLIVAALDAGRFGWSQVPIAITVAAYVAMGFFFGIAFWAMLVNPHFEASVRIQSDRDHQVISRGPYRVVRHPGYLGGVASVLLAPLMLGSLWAYLPALLCLSIMVVRTLLEDRTLRAELPGYSEYAQRTRYRLVPMVW